MHIQAHSHIHTHVCCMHVDFVRVGLANGSPVLGLSDEKKKKVIDFLSGSEFPRFSHVRPPCTFPLLVLRGSVFLGHLATLKSLLLPGSSAVMCLKSLYFIRLHLRDCSFNRILFLIRISRLSPIVIHLLLKPSGYCCFLLISCQSKTYFRVPAVTQPVPNVLRLLANLILYSALTFISPKSKCIFLSFSQFFLKLL